MAFSDSILEQYRVGKAADTISGSNDPISTDAIIDSFKFGGGEEVATPPQVTPQGVPQNIRQIIDPSIIEKRIRERGTVYSEFSPKTDVLNRIGTGLKTVGLPLELAESTISNPIIAIQQGRFNPIDLIKETAQGLVGLRQGEFGDILSNVGAPDLVAAAGGLGAAVAMPVTLIKLAGRLGKVSKFVDAKTSKAINSFVKAVAGKNGALVKADKNMQRYYNEIGTAKINQSKFLDLLGDATNTTKKYISDIPNVKLVEAEDKLLELVQKGDINSVRAAKQIVDDLVSNWHKTATGGNLSRGQGKLVEISRDLGKLMDKGAKAAKNSKYAEKFRNARHDYSNMKKGYQSIQSKMVNPKTGQPTKTGKLLNEILDNREGDVRKTLATMNKFGSKSNRFAQDLKSIEQAVRFREFGSKVIKTFTFGATAGFAFDKASDAFDAFRGKSDTEVFKGISGGG